MGKKRQENKKSNTKNPMPNQLKVQSNRTEKIAKRKQLREKDYKNAILKKKLVKQNDGGKSQMKTYLCEIAKP